MLEVIVKPFDLVGAKKPKTKMWKDKCFFPLLKSYLQNLFHLNMELKTTF